MKLRTALAYYEQTQTGKPTLRGLAIGPTLEERDDGSTVLAFDEGFRVRIVDVARVKRDAPSELAVVNLDGATVSLKPLTLAAYRRYIKGPGWGAPQTQTELEHMFGLGRV